MRCLRSVASLWAHSGRNRSGLPISDRCCDAAPCPGSGRNRLVSSLDAREKCRVGTAHPAEDARYRGGRCPPYQGQAVELGSEVTHGCRELRSSFDANSFPGHRVPSADLWTAPGGGDRMLQEMAARGRRAAVARHGSDHHLRNQPELASRRQSLWPRYLFPVCARDDLPRCHAGSWHLCGEG